MLQSQVQNFSDAKSSAKLGDATRGWTLHIEEAKKTRVGGMLLLWKPSVLCLERGRGRGPVDKLAAEVALEI